MSLIGIKRSYPIIFGTIKLYKHILMLPVDRFPARPYIKEGFLLNTTVLVNSTATLECRTISDLEPHIEWIKFHIVDNANPNIPENITKLEVQTTFAIDGGGYLKN